MDPYVYAQLYFTTWRVKVTFEMREIQLIGLSGVRAIYKAQWSWVREQGRQKFIQSVNRTPNNPKQHSVGKWSTRASFYFSLKASIAKLQLQLKVPSACLTSWLQLWTGSEQRRWNAPLVLFSNEFSFRVVRITIWCSTQFERTDGHRRSYRSTLGLCTKFNIHMIWNCWRFFLSSWAQFLMFCQQARDSPKHKTMLLHWELESRLRMRIVQVKVAADDRDRQSYDQNSAHGTGATNDFSWPRLWGKVTISHGGHGDETPPEGLWDRGKQWLFVHHDFNVVNNTGKHHHWNEKNEKKKNKLVETGLQCVHHDLQSVR